MLPQETGSYLQMCSGGWEVIFDYVFVGLFCFVLEVEGEAVEWEHEIGRNRN